MYNCTRALVRRHGANQRLLETQVNTMSVRELINDYTIVYLVLTHPALPSEVSLNLEDVADVVFKLSPTVTVDQWLTSNGDKTLPTSTTVPKKAAGVAKYRDLFVAGYHAEKVHPTSGSGNSLLDAELTDLQITREGADYKEIYEHALFTINGLCHIADYSSKGVFIKGGGRSIHYANRNQIGITSFLDVGKMSFYPITDTMIKSVGLDEIGRPHQLKKGVLLNLPNVDLSNKVVMISLMGVLHYASNRYKVVGDHSILLEWWKLPLMELINNTRPYIDISSFEATLDPVAWHKDAIDLNLANTDDSIKAFLKLKQTFIILIEADNFFYNRIAVEQTGLPGRYVHPDRPRYPLQLENGFLPEYMTYDDHGQYVIAVDQNLAQRYAHHTRTYSTEDNYVNSAKRSEFPNYYASAYLLEMGRDFVQ